MTSPAGWYPDHQNPTAERYWDGQQWTPQTRPNGQGGVIPPPPAPGSPASAPVARRKRRRWPWIVAAIIGLIVIASIASANSGKENNTSSGDQTTSATTRPATTTSAPTKAASAPRTIGTFTGSGTKKTKRFHVAADDWTIRYSYDCSNFGSQGNFQVFVYNQDDIPDVAVNELAAKGADSTEEHSSGDFYLEINSECTWTIKVIA